jgi:hypothetical protein
MARPHPPAPSRSINPPSYYNLPTVQDIVTIGSNTSNQIASADYEPNDKILEVATAGLNHHFFKLLNEQSKQNAYTISEYVLAMNSEINPSASHRENQLKILCTTTIYVK